MKFKVEDIVKVTCADEESSTPNTRNRVGQVGKITHLTGIFELPYSVYFETDGAILNFMEKEIALNIRVGEQLMFEFMR